MTLRISKEYLDTIKRILPPSTKVKKIYCGCEGFTTFYDPYLELKSGYYVLRCEHCGNEISYKKRKKEV